MRATACKLSATGGRRMSAVGLFPNLEWVQKFAIAHITGVGISVIKITLGIIDLTIV